MHSGKLHDPSGAIINAPRAGILARPGDRPFPAGHSENRSKVKMPGGPKIFELDTVNGRATGSVTRMVRRLPDNSRVVRQIVVDRNFSTRKAWDARYPQRLSPSARFVSGSEDIGFSMALARSWHSRRE